MTTLTMLAIGALPCAMEAQEAGAKVSYPGELSSLGLAFTYFTLSGSPASVTMQSVGDHALELRVMAGGQVFAPSEKSSGTSQVRKIELPPGLQGECIVQVRTKDGPGRATPYTLSVAGMGLSGKEAQRADLIAEINASEAARRKRIEDFLEGNSFSPPGDGKDYYIEDVVAGTPIIGSSYNVDAQTTNSASTVVEGGSLGLGLVGKELPPIGVWDPAPASTTHPEFGGRVKLGDGAGTIGSHATHVTGTIAAAGIDRRAKGFVPQAQVITYSSSGDAAEMTAAARNGMLLSNHSYGSSGSDYSPTWDKVSLVSEFYLPVRASGNGGGEEYGVVTNHGNSKNVMTVGSVNDLRSGYTGPDNVTISDFNRFGPTTDGRIKPDIMSNGQGLYSTKNAAGVDTYGSSSGTSMATPAALGSMALMQEYYFKTHRQTFMKAATLKGLVIASAHEIGAPGPAYNSGWGLINTRGAIDIIRVDSGGRGGAIKELTLKNRDTLIFTFRPKAGETPAAVISWTDPLPSTSLSETAPKLVNDLDLRVTIDRIPYLPWKLNQTTPAAPASKGDNVLDNVEKVSSEKAGGDVMTVRITHKRTLAAPQNFSLIVRGAVEAGVPVMAGPDIGNPRPIGVGNIRLTPSSLSFTAPAGNHTIALFSQDGRNLGTLFDGHLEAGLHQFKLDRTRLSAGAVIARISGGKRSTAINALRPPNRN